MLDSFRSGGANSPETFVTAIAAILARYPDKVIYEVTDPLSGIPVQQDWMPSIKDVFDACERAHLPIRHERDRQKRIADAMVAREAGDDAPHKPSSDEMTAKYGENYGLDPLKAVKTLEENKAENAAALEQATARVDAEYQRAGLVKPSKFALSLTARREMAERDEYRKSLMTGDNT